MIDLNGLYQMLAGFVPTGLNPKVWIARSEHVYGAPQIFNSIDELVAFYPGKLRRGNEARVIDYPAVGTITKFILSIDPSFIIDIATETSKVTKDNWRDFWDEVDQTAATIEQVWNFAPTYNGGLPPHKSTSPHYAVDEAAAWESNWAAIRDPSKGHVYGRVRSSNDFIDYEYPPSSGTFVKIYTGWSLPINLANPYAPGDYIENRWKRQDIADAPVTIPANLINDGWYVVEEGTITETNADGVDTERGKGSYFKALASNTYVFGAGAIAQRIPNVPPRTLSDGTPNNEPTGWTDDIPIGAEQLWKIWAQKTKFGQLKTPWYLEKIIENKEYVRYNNLANPLPESICPFSKSVDDTGGDPLDPLKTYDELLAEQGWDSAYDDKTHLYIATRQDAIQGNPGPNFTVWKVERIAGESGVYLDTVFKLFDRTADYDTVIAAGKPTGQDPSDQGWSDLPVAETATQRLYYSQGWKFVDGSLKSDWSDPQPYTGDDLFVDEILVPEGDTFKYEPNDPNNPSKVIPDQIRLIAALYRSNQNLWEDVNNNITYEWTLIYNDGEIDPPTVIDNDTNKDIYWLSAHTDADGNDWLDGQVVVVNPDGVDGKAYFKVIQTLEVPDGDDMVFDTIIAISDFSDGKDAKKLEISQSHDGPVMYDTVNTVWIPEDTVLTPLYSNLVNPTFKWFRYTAGAWVQITGAEAEYDINQDSLIVLNDQLFTADGSGQEQRFAVTTHPTNPDSADYQTTFSDYHTITKTGAPGAGVDGVSPAVAILTNEAVTIVLNSDVNDPNYGEPFSGEIGLSGKATTLLEVWKDGVKLTYGTNYTIVIAPTTGDVQFSSQIAANAKDAEIYATVWNNPGTIIRSATCSITITLVASGEIISKNFSISTTLDAPGAMFVDIESDKGTVFDSNDRTNKTLTANIYSITSGIQQTLSPVGYYFRWYNGATPLTGWVADSNVYSLARSTIFLEANIRVLVSQSPTGVPVLFSRTERFTDILDGKTYRLYSSQVAKPSPPPTTQQPGTTVGVWGPDPTDAVWASDGTEIPNTTAPVEYNWSEAYQIGGEAGEIGPSSGFMLPMYKLAATKPPIAGSTDSLTTMEGNGWAYYPPVPSAGTYLWRTHRSWQAYLADPITGILILDVGGDPQPVQFTSGKPNTNPMPGSAWLDAEKLTQDDGINGDFYEKRVAKNTSATVAPGQSQYNTWKSNRYPPGWVLPNNLGSVAEGEYVWEITGKIDGQDDSILKGFWSFPIRLSGLQGPAAAQTYQDYKGAWNTSTLYEPNNVVDWLGKYYVATANVGPTGNTPDVDPSNWNVIHPKETFADAFWADPSWIYLGIGTVYYRKDNMGIVHMKGAADLPIGPASLATMPAGYRPGVGVLVPIYNRVRLDQFSTQFNGLVTIASYSGNIRINTTGNITLEDNGTGYVNSYGHAYFGTVQYLAE